MMRERRGNPVLFGKETFKVLQLVSGDQGGRAVFNKFKVDTIPWIDDRALLDVDQVGDYDRLIRAYFEFMK
jgi:CTP:molybdopterin cytidylyltransferase MocA